MAQDIAELVEIKASQTVNASQILSDNYKAFTVSQSYSTLEEFNKDI
jgi:hypothetical protein